MQVGRFELVDRRVLAALRFVDAVMGLPASGLVEVAGARVVRNSGGLYVLLEPKPPQTELDAYTSSFRDAPAIPAPGSRPLALTITPSGPYLPRAAGLELPLQSDDKNAAGFLLRPVQLRLFPAPVYAAEPQWALLRVSVFKQGADPPEPLGGVLLRVLRSPGGELLGLGLSDSRGEALVAVPRLTVLSLAAPDVAVTLEARRDLRLEAGQPPDPDAIETAPAGTAWLATATKGGLTIAPGRTTVVSVGMT
ncbi:MAG TPA: hypothetical protein VFS21_22185 [Roseiflexaceae bacterium]|nr:hypothetical protein [Roseiflexaceae bacterium]